MRDRAFVQPELRTVAENDASDALVADTQSNEHAGYTLREVGEIFTTHSGW